MAEKNEDLEDIFDELAQDLLNNPPNKPHQNAITVPKTTNDLAEDEDLEKYINDNVQVNSSLVSQITANFANQVGDDPERIAAFATLVKSNADLMKILNQRLIKSKDNKVKIEIEKLRQQGDTIRDAIETEKSIVSNRDAFFKELLKDAEDAEIVEKEEKDQE